VTKEELRLAVRERAQRRCEYCRLPDVLPETLRFHLEHVLARQHGGTMAPENLAWSCQRCNERKGPNLSGVDPDTSVVVRLFHPRQDKWEEHFAFDGPKIVGRTPAGRATVWLLEMNSDERLRWRSALRRYGLF
jgi:hypothetical protein